MRTTHGLLLFAWLPAVLLAQGPVVTVLNDFESKKDIDRFAGRVKYVYVAPSSELKTSGERSCEARFFTDCCSDGTTCIKSLYAQGDYPYQDWGPYREFAVDIYSAQDVEIPIHLSFGDKKKEARFQFALKPREWTAIVCPVSEIRAKGVDVAKVAEIQVFQRLDEMRAPNRVYLDHMRLVGTDADAIAAAKAKEDATSAERVRTPAERTDLATLVPELIAKGQKTIRVEKDVPIVYETDVVVVGGGLAGTAAAVAAAREGAKVILIERAGCLGGMATSGLVPPILNVRLTEGMERELVDRLDKAGGPEQNRNPEIIKQVLYTMAHEAGVKLLLYTWATGAVVENGAIRGVFIESKQGTQAILGKVVIDCTGDGDIAVSAGAPFEIGRGRDDETQCVTLVFLLGNVDTTRMCGKDVDVRALFQQSRKAKEFESQYAAGICAAPVVKGKHGVVNVNSINVPLIDGLKSTDLTYAQAQCQRDILGLLEFFRKRVPGCEESYVLSTAAWMGVRETRRIMGDYVLTGEDILQCNRFDDVIARGFFFVDIHVSDGSGDAAGMRPPSGYDIPYRCLVPQKVDNLLVAGRCISCDHIAHGSIRIMGTTIALGEAAGYAAAIAVRDKTTPRKVDTKKLQEMLKAHKALPPGPKQERVPDNLALFVNGTKVTADSIYAKEGIPYSPKGAVDGYDSDTSGSRWLSDDTPPPHWLELDFGAPKTFEFVRLRFWAPEGSDNNAYVGSDYSIQIQKDGRWVDVASVKDNAKRVVGHKFNPVTAQKVRLYITKPCRVSNNITRLREIEVHEEAPPDAH